MKNDYRYQITRSFARKVNIGNYQTVDFFASHTQEMPADTADEEKKKISETLFLSAKLEVEAAINDFQADQVKKNSNQSKIDFEHGNEVEADGDEEDRSKKLKLANEAFGTK